MEWLWCAHAHVARPQELLARDGRGADEAPWFLEAIFDHFHAVGFSGEVRGGWPGI